MGLGALEDSTPEMVRSDTPMQRVWSLFIHARAEKVVVIDKEGHFCGLITRSLLIEAMRDRWDGEWT